MNIRSIFTKLSIAITLAAIAATATVWEVRRVRATTPPDPERFGMVGITHGQTIRLNLVNLVPPPSDGSIPPPCRVVLSFRDANGRPFTNSDGQVIRREVSLQSGESAFLDLNGDMFGGLSTNADTTGPARTQLRPFVRVLTPPPDPDRGSFPPPCFPTTEIYDNATGRTSIFAAEFASPPDPEGQ